MGLRFYSVSSTRILPRARYYARVTVLSREGDIMVINHPSGCATENSPWFCAAGKQAVGTRIDFSLGFALFQAGIDENNRGYVRIIQ